MSTDAGAWERIRQPDGRFSEDHFRLKGRSIYLCGLAVAPVEVTQTRSVPSLTCQACALRAPTGEPATPRGHK